MRATTPDHQLPRRIDHTWTLRAACRGMDVETFFTFSRGGHPLPQAVAACRACPVRRPCLDEELRANPTAAHQVGYRAGTTPADRRKLLRTAGGRS